MARQDDLDFLRYFFRSCIPPFKNSLPGTEREYINLCAGSYEVWRSLEKILHRVSLPDEIKHDLAELFSTSRSLLMVYTITVHKTSYERLMMRQDMKDQWEKIQRLAQNIDNYAKASLELRETPILDPKIDKS